MKRFSTFALLWCLCMIANVALADDTVTDSQGLKYSVSGTNATVLRQGTNGGLTSADAVVIPKEFVAVEDGVTYTVTALADYAFYSTTFSSVTFEDGIAITSIPTYAFYDCKGISSIVIPEGVTSIGNYAFCCSTKEYTLTSVTWPASLGGSTLGTKAFSYRCGLTQITSYATSTIKIGTQTFNGISDYSAITLWVPCNYSSTYSNFSFNIAEFGCEGEGDYSYTYSPNPEEVVEELSTITVGCNDAIEYANDGSKTVTVTNSNDEQVTTGTCSSGCVITLADAITDDGTYTVTIPAGYFLVGSGKEASEEMVLTYTVGEIDTSIQFVPADGAELEEGTEVETITVKRNGYLTQINPGISVTNSNGVTIATVEQMSAYSSTATSSFYTVVLSDVISGGGEYTIHLSAGSFILSEDLDDLNEATTATFTILGEPAVELTGDFLVSPEEGTVESLSSFTFSRDTGLEFSPGQGDNDEDIYEDWPDDETVIKLYRGDILVAQGELDCLENDSNYVFHNDDRYSYALALTIPLAPVDGSSVENFEITEPGTYTLYIPPYVFTDPEDNYVYLSSTALTYTYTIAGTETAVFEIDSPEVEATDTILYSAYEDLEAINVSSSITGTTGSVKYSIVDTADESELATGTFASYVAGDNTDTPWLMATGYYTLTPSEADFVAGHTYTFNVADGSAEEAAATTLFYIEGPLELTFDPESDTTVDSLSTITVTPDEGKTIAYISESTSFTVYKDEAATDYIAWVDEENSDDTQIVFNIGQDTDTPEAITDAGAYTIVFLGNTFSVNGFAYDEPIEVNYTIASAEPIELTFDPEDGSIVDELGAITVSSDQGTVTYISDESDFAVSVDGEESEDYIAWYDEDQDADGSIVMVVNDGSWSADEGIITDAGEYSVTFPEGTFAVGGVSYDEEVTLTYTIESTSNEGGESGEGEGSGSGEGEGEGEGDGTETGISAIQAAIANGAEVYTISGQKVSAPVSGVNVVKYADGTVKKILQK